MSIQQREKKEFDELLEIIEPTNTEKPKEETGGVISVTDDETEPLVTEPEAQGRNLDPLFEKNAECIGWLCIEGTNINYPVMHTPSNPQKYLRKNFEGEYSQSGVPFLDADFRSSHPTIEFQTATGIRYYTVVDVIRTDIYDEIYNNISSEDNTLILSTCYGSAKSGRLLIIAKEATG